MAALQNFGGVSSKSWEKREKDEEGRDRETLMDVFCATVREKIVLQRLIVIARLPCYLTERTEIAAHYERLNFQINKQYIWDHMTGLLLIYPNCVLHVIESSRDVLFSVLKDLRDMQQQTTQSLLEGPKVMFMDHGAQNRLFQQWSYKVLDVDQNGKPAAVEPEEEEDGIDTLVCSVLSTLQNLGRHLEITKKALPGLLLDESPELVVSQDVVGKLLTRHELLDPQLYLQMYDSSLNVRLTFGHGIQSSCVTTI
ncbi:testis-expressed protein 47 [Cynoglossus semilaevis]|uniref:testis-expressed protein 47 n=1 Tax=Cynoglossus semilaevis TaxID=244447 RepID=UPI000495CD55|nr:testis-expressed protein 47 [Cynoglossus semilaevis]